MLKIEVGHDFQKDANGRPDYTQKMVERDYSALREVRRDVVDRGGYTQTYVTFGEGLTLEYKSEYLGDGDSVGAVAVWNPVTKQPEWFGLGYEPCRVELLTYDATPEVKAEYEAWKKQQEFERLHQSAIIEDAQRTAEIENEKVRPSKGKTVRVVRGRKVPIGTIAKVFWYGHVQGRFGGARVGLEIEDDIAGKIRVFTSAYNVEPVEGIAK